MSRAPSATINLTALNHNFSVVKQAAPASKVMAVIKANAYGHGLVPIAKALPEADAFAVAHLEEAVALREANIQQRIVVLQGFEDEVELSLFVTHSIDSVVHTLEQVEMLEKSKLTQALNVWLKVDTGMHRIGVNTDQFEEVWQRLNDISYLKNHLHLMTHFANADDKENQSTSEQITLFEKTVQEIDVEKSLANSAGLMHWPESHADWVRPGIMLYGASPYLNSSAESLNLQTVMTLKSRLIAIKEVRAGESVGYGSTWTATQNTRLGVIGIGYGDGYPRHVASETPVLIDGKRYPIIGRVSMDMICVDLHDNTDIKVGDEVILWGDDLPVDLIAKKAGTIAYELLCQITPRVRFEWQKQK